MNIYERPILLIEDNPMDVDLTRRAFTKRKLLNPIQVARDGEEALTYLQKWEEGERLPVIILLDLKLPRIDGLEVLRQFKQHPKARAIPIIVMTSSNDDKDILEAYTLGANSYIIKPVDFDKFIQVAEQIDLYWNVLNIPPRPI